MRRDEAESLFSPEALLYEDLYLLPISLSKSSFFLTPSAVGGRAWGRVEARREHSKSRNTSPRNSVAPSSFLGSRRP